MKWIPAKTVPIPDALIEYTDGNRLMAEVLVKRGMTSIEAAERFIHPEAYNPSSPYEMPGLVQAVDLISAAIQDGRKIGVWGDFDVDGQTSTTLLVSALKTLNADVIHYIPVRATESHGVHIPSLDTRMILEGVDLLLTCDTGISAHEAVQHAKKRGLTVIITDHHDLPEQLPEADAIINSKLLEEGHPLSTLAGVGVAYKLAEALFGETGNQDHLPGLLDLVALGLVADIAILTGDARYLVQRGLEVLRNTNRLGLRELMKLADLEASHITEEHIGFTIAPRLNALGRLGDANVIVEFLTTDDPVRTRVIANQLEGLNAQRKMLTDQVFQGALAQLEQNPSLLDHAALVLSNPAWPGGVIGIVASRLVERFNKPTILLTAPPGELARGSARSIEGCHITKAIEENKALLKGFGGHPMAAGMSLPAENIDAFRKGLSKSVAKQLGKEKIEHELAIDLELPLDQLDFDLVSELEKLAPFGPGNPKLVYAARKLNLKMAKVIGKTQDHLVLNVVDEHGHEQRLFWWNGAGWEQPDGTFDLAFSARINSFRGEQQLQVELVDFQVTEEPELPAGVKHTVIDYRKAVNPEKLLEELKAAEESLAIWAEAGHMGTVGGSGRHELAPAEALAIWTTPPTFSILEKAVEQVQPKRIYLFDNNSGMDQAQPFVQRMTGLCKYGMENKGGELVIDELAAAASQTRAAVRTAISWLDAKQFLSIEQDDYELISVSKSDPALARLYSVEMLQSELKSILQETEYFREYYRDMEIQRLETL
ncbi:MAG TPA: single-stranded-DNA-specific exonuclease RecJ [Anaerolineales bacterium]|nr:single-stranded-DNA-specific exonuclease RecJ [Anaerolineales bacterium]